jgi:hypothetical protein
VRLIKSWQSLARSPAESEREAVAVQRRGAWLARHTASRWSVHGHRRATPDHPSEFKERVRRGEVPRLVLPELATRRLGGSPQLAVRLAGSPQLAVRLVGSPQHAGVHKGSASMSRQLEERGELRRLRAGLEDQRPVTSPTLPVVVDTATAASKLAMRQVMLQPASHHPEWKWTWRTQRCW